MSRSISRQRLSNRILATLVGFLCLALLAIGSTLLLSWQLEGGAAAINDTGSLRMQSYRLAALVHRAATGDELDDQIGRIDQSFTQLRKGDPQRPLLLPPDSRIQQAFDAADTDWQQELRAQAARAAAGTPEERLAFEQQTAAFVDRLDALVARIERDLEQRTLWLRLSQFALIGLALFGTLGVVYLLFLMIIEPVNRLRVGMLRMAAGEFDARVAVSSRDEFGELADGFNTMAAQLQESYADLEQRVQAKTAMLATQNRELELLYGVAAFLQKPQAIDTACQGFLTRLCAATGAAAGWVHLADERHGQLYLAAAESEADSEAESESASEMDSRSWQRFAAALDVLQPQPGQPSSQVRIQPLQAASPDGGQVVLVPLQAGEQQLGCVSLYFPAGRALPENEQVLLTLGKLLGVAIDNLRLGARRQEMAVSEERNLVAKQLHDSIAQGLTFLNLQVQMLQASLDRAMLDEARGIVPLLRTGVQESYDNVRELLVNFRNRVGEEDLPAALQQLVERFRAQTGINATLQVSGRAVSVSRQDQLQLQFIVQEALSNVRRHAAARHVEVRLANERELQLSVCDDGQGFDADAVVKGAQRPVGLHIMQERAQRIHATLAIASAPGRGTEVRLALPQPHACAA